MLFSIWQIAPIIWRRLDSTPLASLLLQTICKSFTVQAHDVQQYSTWPWGERSVWIMLNQVCTDASFDAKWPSWLACSTCCWICACDMATWRTMGCRFSACRCLQHAMFFCYFCLVFQFPWDRNSWEFFKPESVQTRLNIKTIKHVYSHDPGNVWTLKHMLWGSSGIHATNRFLSAAFWSQCDVFCGRSLFGANYR